MSQSINCSRHSAPEPLTLGLTSCEGDEASGWSATATGNDLEQVCWKKNSDIRHLGLFCLYKRQSSQLMVEDLTYTRRFDGKVHLLKSKMTGSCLGASPNEKLTSKELKRGSFSPCGWDANQMWELNYNGTLMNSYSGLCASMRTKNANPRPMGVRAWIATGRKGEIYVAFFNLDNRKADVSMTIADLGKALPGKIGTASCKCREEWRGKECGVIKGSVSTQLEIHGSALFVLNCT